MAFEEIRYEVDQRVLTITLHRPDKLNAFTERMAREVIDEPSARFFRSAWRFSLV